MTLNEKLATIQLSLNLKNLDLTHSANTTLDQPKTFSKQQNPLLRS